MSRLGLNEDVKAGTDEARGFGLATDGRGFSPPFDTDVILQILIIENL